MRRGFSGLRAAALFTAAVATSWLFTSTPTARAADHGDAPALASDAGADIADIFFFLNPADNSKAVFVFTTHGFIVPGEALNFSVFDPNIRYRINIENTGDTKVDQTIDVTFTPKATAAADAQVATIKYGKITFTAPTTPSNLSAVPTTPAITTDTASGISFFAGETDDPFFFDIPGFSRFVGSIRAGAPDGSHLQRGRDTFAGYNVMTIALEVPVALLKSTRPNVENPGVIGASVETDRKAQVPNKKGTLTATGAFRQLDRQGNPAVNVVLIPFARKNEYNAFTPRDDAKGRFASDIVATLTSLGTDQAHIATLASVAVTNGDFLRLNTTVANSGAGGGDNPGAGFPNGRRLKDDVVDTLLTIVANGTVLGDSVNANDVPLRDAFPFVAPPQQPREPGVVDDNTRN